MEHDFMPDGPVKDGWRESVCIKCSVRIRVPEEGTARALARGVQHIMWTYGGNVPEVSIADAPVPQCKY